MATRATHASHPARTGALLIDSIIRLASALKLLTIAEGVESQAQLDALRSMKCGGWQGHLYSPALPRQALEALLAAAGKEPPSRL